MPYQHFGTSLDPQRRLHQQTLGQMGPPSRRLAGGWIADLAALGKAIVLCFACERKWKPKAYGYESRQAIRGHHYVIGDCDGCGMITQGRLFIPENRGTWG